ncbi:MAG: hypothetical protein SGI74_01785 [Oligoflexia bacterium]|nr:hypothetical protein [Oligoflexia bacterium]
MEFRSLCPRSYECASLNRALTGPFRANFAHQRDAICGDLATMSNRRDLCEMRSEIFETDPWGYRNTQEVWARKNEILLFGDSFALGQGVTQGEVPSVQLTKKIGKNVYDGAGKLELEYLHWLLDNLKTPPKTVIYFHLERHNHRLEEISGWDKTIDASNIFQKIDVFWKSFWAYDPLKIIFSQFEKGFLIPSLFPNRFAEKVPVFDLQNGKTFLFLDSSVNRYGDQRADDLFREAEYFDELRILLSEKNIKLLIVLIPEKYSVYAPLVKNPKNYPLKNSHYLMSLQGELIRRRMQVINLLPDFIKESQSRHKQGQYIYWPDDTHWNTQGIELATSKIAKHLTTSL